MYKYFIYFLLFFVSVIIALSIIIPIVFGLYLVYIMFFQISYREIDIWHKISSKFTSWLTKYTNISENFIVIDKENIDPMKQYVYVFYPHGMFAISQIIHVSSTESAFAPYLYNSVHACHSLFYSIPIIREISLLFKGIPANREYLDHYLQAGKSVSINPAGLQDIQYCTYRNRNIDHIYITKRKGFIYAAKENNVDIVPIYCWNEQTVLRHTQSLDFLTNILSKCGIRFDCNAFQGLSPTNIIKTLSMIFGKETGTVAYCGTPISVKDKTIDEIHAEFIQSMKTLFEKANADHGSHKTLVIV